MSKRIAARAPLEPEASRARANASPVRAALEAICEAIEAGSTMSGAAWSAGVTPASLEAQIRENPMVQMRVEAARAKAEAREVAKLDELIAQGKPTAGQTWKIERMHRRNFHIPSKVALSGDDDAGPVRAQVEITLAAAIEAARQKDDE